MTPKQISAAIAEAVEAITTAEYHMNEANDRPDYDDALRDVLSSLATAQSWAALAAGEIAAELIRRAGQ